MRQEMIFRLWDDISKVNFREKKNDIDFTQDSKLEDNINSHHESKTARHGCRQCKDGKGKHPTQGNEYRLIKENCIW